MHQRWCCTTPTCPSWSAIWTVRARTNGHAIVEKIPGRAREAARVVTGDAADLDVLREAGIERASSAIVTTHEDDVNVYLTLYCRRLRPDMLILSRSTLDRNTITLHRAGADFVLSYPSIGANAIVNMLRDTRLLFLAEGLDVFTMTCRRAWRAARLPTPTCGCGPAATCSGSGSRTARW